MTRPDPAEGEQDAHDEERCGGKKGSGRQPGDARYQPAGGQAGERETAEKLAVHDPGGSAQEPGLL